MTMEFEVVRIAPWVFLTFIALMLVAHVYLAVRRP